MNEWAVAGLVLIVALIPCGAVCLLSTAASALTAMEVASSLLTAVLLVLSEAVHRQPFVDLALTFAIISLVGSLFFARLMERDL